MIRKFHNARIFQLLSNNSLQFWKFVLGVERRWLALDIQVETNMRTRKFRLLVVDVRFEFDPCLLGIKNIVEALILSMSVIDVILGNKY